MELPEHACISCAYFFQFDKETISRNHRERALVDKNNSWNNGWINYEQLVCHMGKQKFSEFNTNNAVIGIRDEVIKPNRCKEWTIFQGISPMATEQRKYAKWVKPSFLVACITLVVVIVTWVLSQFVFN